MSTDRHEPNGTEPNRTLFLSVSNSHYAVPVGLSPTQEHLFLSLFAYGSRRPNYAYYY